MTARVPRGIGQPVTVQVSTPIEPQIVQLDHNRVDVAIEIEVGAFSRVRQIDLFSNPALDRVRLRAEL